MLEAVGETLVLADLLRQAAAIADRHRHSRAASDHDYEGIVVRAAYRRRPDFIQRFIFPGGMLPTLDIIPSASRISAGLHLVTQQFVPAQVMLARLARRVASLASCKDGLASKRSASTRASSACGKRILFCRIGKVGFAVNAIDVNTISAYSGPLTTTIGRVRLSGPGDLMTCRAWCGFVQPKLGHSGNNQFIPRQIQTGALIFSDGGPRLPALPSGPRPAREAPFIKSWRATWGLF